MLNEFAWDERYRLGNTDDVLTPALVVYPEAISSNIEQILRLLDGDANRWRVHVKTAKLEYALRMLAERSIRNFKCATTLELLVACRSGAKDVLVAYPMVGANARRVNEIAETYPQVRISVLAENEEQVRQWQGTCVGVFLDINPGMNRTGIEQNHSVEAVSLARAVRDSGLEFRGLHYYDGQYGGLDERERTAAAHAGYDSLLKIVGEVESGGVSVPEVITAGTPTLPCSLSYRGFRGQKFVHRVSPALSVPSMLALPPADSATLRRRPLTTRIWTLLFHGTCPCRSPISTTLVGATWTLSACAADPPPPCPCELWVATSTPPVAPSTATAAMPTTAPLDREPGSRMRVTTFSGVRGFPLCRADDDIRAACPSDASER